MKVEADAEHSMVEPAPAPAARDKLLFTPGPLTTSLSVKQAMLHDAGSWDFEFGAVVARIRAGLLRLAGLNEAEGWEVVLLQGSGTFGVEAVFQTCVPPDGKVAVLANGAYGERMAQMLKHARIDHVVVRSAEDTPHDPVKLDDLLAKDKAVTHVAAVHCETTTGLLNPINPLGQVARKHGKVWVVDAMSSFGGIPVDFHAGAIDYLISSANKCVEGVPGFSFVFCRRPALASCEGYARSLSLDLLSQLRGFEKNGQFFPLQPVGPRSPFSVRPPAVAAAKEGPRCRVISNFPAFGFSSLRLNSSSGFLCGYISLPFGPFGPVWSRGP